eukprot:GHUV01046452.1.p1 GENE.GHUV01046452.1~~GHUV01046452.1.p1  ORF type:complete len:115 (+),score=18.59 GHUV01046452.1:283-627(+)
MSSSSLWLLGAAAVTKVMSSGSFVPFHLAILRATAVASSCRPWDGNQRADSGMRGSSNITPIVRLPARIVRSRQFGKAIAKPTSINSPDDQNKDDVIDAMPLHAAVQCRRQLMC